jgi:hypothetical protein
MAKDREFVELVKRIHERSLSLSDKLHPRSASRFRLRNAGFILLIVRRCALLAMGLAMVTVLGFLAFWLQTLQRAP